ncbi:MAG: TIGR04282 family arsenosugar biosynthesis glycosyltransferase [Pseudomonadota bacterium]
MTKIGVFGRPPRPGQVKTRLIPSIGAENATRVYQHCLEHALKICAEADYPFQLFLTALSNDHIFAGITSDLQQGENLGERMYHALSNMLSGNTSAMIIGSDCLDMSTTRLIQAAEALEDHDLVLIPAIDGGYALIGCRRIDLELFQSVKWSTDEVLTQTLKNAERLNYRVCLLESVRDIDTLHDLEHYPQLLELIDP